MSRIYRSKRLYGAAPVTTHREPSVVMFINKSSCLVLSNSAVGKWTLKTEVKVDSLMEKVSKENNIAKNRQTELWPESVTSWFH